MQKKRHFKLPILLIFFLSGVGCLGEDRNSEIKFTDLGLEIHLLKEPALPSLKIARLNNPITAVYLKTDTVRHDLKMKPQPDFWEIVLPQNMALKGTSVIIETIGKPMLAGQTIIVEPDSNGTLYLHAHLATAVGETLRYEPQPNKNTLGYWTNETDYPEWVFQVDQAGKYRVVIHQGCGEGQGGSQAEVRVGDQTITFKVEDTGGFQNFEARRIGTLKIESTDPQTLQVHILRLAKKAAMDLRLIELIPVE
jgi:hypothetical protein